MSNKHWAEMMGTMTLVLLGCGTAVVAGAKVGILGVAFAFGLALIGMAYAIGHVSGCHINPAVSLGNFMADRMELKEMLGYILAQCVGAVIGAAIILFLTKGAMMTDAHVAVTNFGQNGFGEGYGGGYGMMAAMVFEAVATFLFVMVVLGSTEGKHATVNAGLAIGLMLVVIHLFGIDITGVSVNPARSLGPALLVGGHALDQLWLFIVAPLVGGGLAGLFHKKLQ
jgi:aquaporin Z